MRGSSQSRRKKVKKNELEEKEGKNERKVVSKIKEGKRGKVDLNEKERTVMLRRLRRKRIGMMEESDFIKNKKNTLDQEQKKER